MSLELTAGREETTKKRREAVSFPATNTSPYRSARIGVRRVFEDSLSGSDSAVRKYDTRLFAPAQSAQFRLSDYYLQLDASPRAPKPRPLAATRFASAPCAPSARYS